MELALVWMVVVTQRVTEGVPVLSFSCKLGLCCLPIIYHHSVLFFIMQYETLANITG